MKLSLAKIVLKPIILIVFILILSQTRSAGQTTSQAETTGELLYQLQISKPDTNRINLLNKLVRNYFREAEINKAEFESIFKYLHQAIKIADSMHVDFGRWKYESASLLAYVLMRSGNYAEGQHAYMDLVATTHNSGDKKREADIWHKYAWALSSLNLNYQGIDSGLTRAMLLYREMNNRHAEIDMCIELADLHDREDKPSIAEQEYLTLLKKTAAAASYRSADIYFNLSRLNRYGGNFNKALGYALLAVRRMEETKDSVNAHNYYGEIAEVYQALNKPAESVFWYKKCLLKRESMDYYQYGLYRTYNLLVTQLIKTGASLEALAAIKNLRQKSPPRGLSERAVLYQSLAYCYQAHGDIDSTEKYFLASLDGYHKTGAETEIISLIATDIASFYVTQKQFKKAAPYLDEALRYNPSSSGSLRIQLLLFRVDSAAGNYLSSIHHLQHYTSLHDSIFNEATGKQIEELKIQYETEKKDKDLVLKDKNIELLTKKDQLQQSVLRQANITRNWVLGSSLLLIVLLAVVYNRYRLKQKSAKLLEEQQATINQKNISLQHLVNEKEWLAKEIHHRVKNNFHIVMGLLGTQSGYLKNEEAIAAVKESQQRIHAMSLIHQKLYQSENLSAIDLPGYIHELVDYLKDSLDNGRSIKFHLQIDRISLGLSYVVPIGLILNESITNVIKYAFPDNRQGNIYISFTQSSNENRIVLAVRDDGIGLPQGFNSTKQASMGMNLMKGLTEDIDGAFAIQSNNGTAMTVSFMYNPDISTDFAPSATGQNFI